MHVWKLMAADLECEVISCHSYRDYNKVVLVYPSSVLETTMDIIFTDWEC
jgi:hypothetical protein